jgi:glycosyltransferase involved in cell wall biosynthesis
MRHGEVRNIGMAADPISVSVAVSTAPYQKALASSLLSAGMLRQLIEFAPFMEISEPNGDGELERKKNFPIYSFSKRVLWGVWRRLPSQVRPSPPITVSASLADRLLSKWIAPCRIFHGCTAHCLASLRAAKQMGALTLVENAACHPRHWERVEKKEHRRFSVSSDNGIGSYTERLMRRMEIEYETCDRIVVPSVVAQQNFVEFGLGEKTVVVQTGVDANFFVPGPTEPPPAFRVCYVGRVELAKGIGYLLEAWKRVGLRGAELVLVGEVKPQMKELLDSYSGCGVRLPGFLPAHEVARCYRESHLFVQPSPNEGLAQALLEAMASGLPVVATDKTGALDCMMNGKEGLIVPAQDANALAGAILWCYQNRDEIQEMGKAARVRIESEFTLEHYNQRVIKLYRNLVSTPRITIEHRI